MGEVSESGWGQRKRAEKDSAGSRVIIKAGEMSSAFVLSGVRRKPVKDFVEVDVLLFLL